MPITKLKFEYNGMRHETAGAHPRGFWIEAYNEDVTITFNYFAQHESYRHLKLICDIYILHEGRTIYDWEDYDLTPEGYVTDESRHFSYKIPANSRIYVSSNIPLKMPDPESAWETEGIEPLQIDSDKPFKIGGNIMSLYSRDDFNSMTTMVSEIGLRNLFAGSKVVDASNLLLPATILRPLCYYYMFSGCTSLTSAPVLPATTLAERCYESMFRGCTNLTSAPALPATTLAPYCYSNMFYGCTNLTSAPALSATTLAPYCYAYMLAVCRSLTSAPALPTSTLAYKCYQGMFAVCTSLTTAPVLPASTLVSGCYDVMFNGCSSLNYIKALFTTTPDGGLYTNNWLNGVPSTGTFVKSSEATWTTTGIYGVPEGWSIEYE